MTVIATSSAVSRPARAGRNLINLRLGMLLEVGDDRRRPARRRHRRVSLESDAEPDLRGRHRGDRRADADAARAAQRARSGARRRAVRRTLPRRRQRARGRLSRQAAAASACSRRSSPAYVSGTLGIGGGILKVPVLNAWCGVPMRAAAATSALMIGVTAVASAPQYFARGQVNPPLAAAAVLGVLVGSRAGFWLRRPRARQVAEAADGRACSPPCPSSISGGPSHEPTTRRSIGSKIQLGRLLVGRRHARDRRALASGWRCGWRRASAGAVDADC